MSDDVSEQDIFVRLSFSFEAITVIQNEFISVAWDFVIDVLPENDLSLESSEIAGAFTKIRYWIDEIVNGSLIFSANNKWANTTFLKNSKLTVGNNLILLPGPITDQVIARVMHSKLVALSGGNLLVGPLELSRADGYGISIYFTGENNDLPNIASWIGKRSFFPVPWWQRDDSSTIDIVPAPKDDLTVSPGYAISLDFLINKRRHKRRKKAEIIRPIFRPKVIVGGT